MTEQPASSPLATPDLVVLAHCVWRRWTLTLVLGLACGTLGALVAQQAIPATFKATALIRLSSPKGVLETPNESATAQRGFRSTQEELIRMPHVLRRALESAEVQRLGVLGTDPDSVEELGDSLELELPRSSEIFRVSVRHDRADVAFILTNAVTEAYLQEVHRASEEELERRLSVLEQLKNESEARLNESWEGLLALARELGSGDPTILSLQAQAEIESYRDYSRRLRELRTEKREAERMVRAILESPHELSREITEDSSMHSVRYAMFQAKLKYQKALTTGGPDHPDALAAKQEENLLREYYQKSSAEEMPTAESRLDEMLSEPRATIARLENEERALEAQIAEIDERIEAIGGDHAAKLEILRNNIHRQEQQSDRLWQTHENLLVERHADPRVQLVSYAEPPRMRDMSKRNKLTLLLACVGFGFALLAVAWGEFLTGRLHSLRDARQRTDVTFVDALPALPETLSSQETRGSRRLQRLTAQMDLFAARLVHHSPDDAPRIILITSPRACGERLRVAPQLAAALARTVRPVLWVNLDFRDPLPELQPPLPAHVQLPNLLARPTEALPETHDALGLSTGIAHLDYLTAEPHAVQPLSILTDSRLPQLLRELAKLYSYVVVEAAAVLTFPDAVHVGHVADLALLSVRRNVSRARDVIQTHERLRQRGVSVLGTMIP